MALLAQVHAQSTNGTDATTAAIDITGAEIVVVFVGDKFGASLISDSLGNTYEARSAYVNLPDSGLQGWYAIAPTTGTAVTWTVTGDVPWVSVLVFDNAGAFIAESGASAPAGVTNLIKSGTITPSSPGVLYVSAYLNDTDAAGVAICYKDGNTVDVSLPPYWSQPPFQTVHQHLQVNLQHHSGAVAYAVDVTSDPMNASWVIPFSVGFPARVAMTMAFVATLAPVPLPTPPAPQINCTPQSNVGNGGKGAAGCNTGGVGFVPSYTGPWGDVPDHDDPDEGETLTGKDGRGVEAWIELNHIDYPSGDVTQILRAQVPLDDPSDYEGGYKTDGLLAIGDVEHSLGNERGGFEAATVDVQLTDARDDTFRDLADDQEFEGDELFVKLASDEARA